MDRKGRAWEERGGSEIYKRTGQKGIGGGGGGGRD